MSVLTQDEKIKLWTDALRSGEYEQGYEMLHYKGEDGKEKYCCLGVLCEVYQKVVGGLEVELDTYGVKTYDDVSATLPILVQDWIGLTDNEGYFVDGKSDEYLTRINDSEEYDFNDIANLIDSRPEGMFCDAQH